MSRILFDQFDVAGQATVTPAALVVALSLTTPTIQNLSHQRLFPQPLKITLTPATPLISNSRPLPPPLRLTMSIPTPTVKRGTRFVYPPPLALSLALPPPAAWTGRVLRPDPLRLTLTLPPPTRLSTTEQKVTPAPLVVGLSLPAPQVMPGPVTFAVRSMPMRVWVQPPTSAPAPAIGPIRLVHVTYHAEFSATGLTPAVQSIPVSSATGTLKNDFALRPKVTRTVNQYGHIVKTEVTPATPTDADYDTLSLVIPNGAQWLPIVTSLFLSSTRWVVLAELRRYSDGSVVRVPLMGATPKTFSRQRTARGYQIQMQCGRALNHQGGPLVDLTPPDVVQYRVDEGGRATWQIVANFSIRPLSTIRWSGQTYQIRDVQFALGPRRREMTLIQLFPSDIPQPTIVQQSASAGAT
jgi:hypothetical protein